MNATAEGPPPKKLRPSSVEDVVLSKAAAPGQGAAPGAKSGRGMLTLEEVSYCTFCSITQCVPCGPNFSPWVLLLSCLLLGMTCPPLPSELRFVAVVCLHRNLLVRPVISPACTCIAACADRRRPAHTACSTALV